MDYVLDLFFEARCKPVLYCIVCPTQMSVLESRVWPVLFTVLFPAPEILLAQQDAY